jgi:hypothetical protein
MFRPVIKRYFLVILMFFFIRTFAYSQKKEGKVLFSLSGGSFNVGQGYITGIWAGTEISKPVFLKKQNKLLNKLRAGGELFFENGADKATVYNPTPQQFISDRFYHESNIGITAKLIFQPFGGVMKGLNISGGPALMYSIRSFEKRAQLIRYSPDLTVRMSEIGSDNKLLGGYRFSASYNINLRRNWIVGIRADISQYHGRDLNSLLGVRIGVIL